MATADRDVARVESGLDALELAQLRGKSRGRKLAESIAPKLAAAGLVIAGWWIATALQLQPSYALPPPQDVGAELVKQTQAGHVTAAVLNSLARGGIGYAISIAIGTPLGLLVARVGFLRLALASLIQSLMSLPSVTWVPVGIMWFGLSERTIYFVVVMGALPSIASGMVSAVDQIPPLLFKVGQSIGARGFAFYRHIVLPAALPGYVGGLKQAWSFSWRSLMAAELITFSPDLGLGLGQLLDSGRELSDMALMLAAILLILAVGLAVEGLVFGPLDRGIRSRRGLVA